MRYLPPYVAALILAGMFVAPAWTCPLCKEAAEAAIDSSGEPTYDDDPLAEARAYNRSIYFMLGVPYTIFAVGGLYCYRHLRGRRAGSCRRSRLNRAEGGLLGVDHWLLEKLACPRDGGELTEAGARLTCPSGHQYPVVEDVPVFLIDDIPQTMWVSDASLDEVRRQANGTLPTDQFYIETLGISEEEKARLREQLTLPDSGVDPVASFLVGATNGIAYKHLIGNLKEYPIPELRLPSGKGETLLDVGCNWGRWCIAAARKGYKPIGIDPSLGAVLAARRLAARLGADARFVVGDGRYLPFRSNCIDVAFSYSVIQHLSREDAALAVQQIGRVLCANGKCLVQMPTVLGIRCLYHQTRRRFREARDFEVRYWTVPALRRLFNERVGHTCVSVDCYFGIGLQASDLRFMPLSHRIAIRASALCATSRVIPPLKYVADSVYLESIKGESS